MARKKITLDSLESEVKKILEAYGDDVSENLDTITKQIGQKGVQALRNESKSSFGGTGDYAKGWKSQVTTNRLYTTVTIYNRKAGLPHLLEHGHAVKSGGRVVGEYKGKEHIAPVEEELIKDYESEVKSKL